MKVCSYCGSVNDDTRSVCEVCGAALPDAPGGTKKKKGLKLNLKPGAVKAIAAVLAAVTVVGGGAAVVLGGSSRRVASAVAQNKDAITEELSQLPQLNAAGEHYTALNDGGNFTLKADITTEKMTLAGNMDYARKDKALAGSLVYENAGQDLDVKFDFASDNKEFTLAANRFTDDIYGFKLKEFAEFYSKTPVAWILPLTNEKNEPNVEFFKKMDFSQSMEAKYGEKWENFKDSLEFEELNERQMEIRGEMVEVRAYEITWDTWAASRLVSTMLGQDEGFLDGFVKLFKAMEPDCRIYVDGRGYMAAMDFVAAGNKVTVKFEGEENVWQVCNVSSLSIAGGPGAISGRLTILDGIVDAEFNWEGTMLYQLHYDDNSGSFDMEALIGSAYWDIDGALTAKNGGVQLHLGGTMPDQGRVDVHISMDPMENEPQLMDDKYVDLMDMDAGNWQRLLIDINNSN